jgi:hypothetical protein
MAELQRLTANQVKANTDYQNQYAQQLDAEYRQRQIDLEKSYENRRAELALQEQAHLKRVNEFEVHESKYMRRALLARIQNALNDSKTVTLSRATNSKRTPIHLASGFTMAVGFGLIAFGVWRMMTVGAIEWPHVLPFSSGALIAGSTLVFYLRWCNQWLSDHADVEFRQMKFHLDILRANWIVEVLFEGDDKDRSVPDKVLERLTTGLFIDPRREASLHPLDDVEQLMRKVKRLRLGKGLLEVEKSVAPEKE